MIVMAEGQRTVTLQVLGAPGSGKSLFIRKLATTLHCKKLKLGKTCYVVELDLEKVIGIPVLVNITEYRGMKFYGPLTFEFRKADACLLFYDREETTSFERAQKVYKWCHYLVVGNPNTYLVENKCDKIDRGDSRREDIDAFITKFQPVKGHYIVSAETGHNIKQMLVDVLQQVLGKRFPREDVADRDHRLGVQTYPVETTAGLCVIVNNDRFVKLSNRQGADKDVTNIESTFGPLGFDMRLIENKYTPTLKGEMEDISKLDHTSNSMFVCFIMSHGSLNSIEGIEGATIDIDSLASLFSAKKCPSLAGKPKLFIIQACLGHQLDPSAAVETDSAAAVPEVSPERITIPVFGDILIAYSTIRGFFAYRDEGTGSPFIQTLCNTIQEFPENHMMDILTMVNEKVAAMEFEGSSKQMPMFQSRLRKNLYLKRPSVTSDHDDIGKSRETND